VGLAFGGDIVELLGWLLLALFSSILIVPLAWTFAAFCRWFCRNLRFGDGASAEFTGKGIEVLVWILLSFLAGLSWTPIVVHWRPPWTLIALHWGPLSIQPLDFVIGPLIALMILRWLARSVQLSGGPALRFEGSYLGCFGYEVLGALSILTIIGWAWVTASWYRWVARRTRGEGIVIGFDGTGGEILWRTLATVLGSLLIVTIPWVFMWYLRWLVSQVTIARGAEESTVRI
jgi:hypothetical protein